MIQKAFVLIESSLQLERFSLIWIYIVWPETISVLSAFHIMHISGVGYRLSDTFRAWLPAQARAGFVPGLMRTHDHKKHQQDAGTLALVISVLFLPMASIPETGMSYPQSHEIGLAGLPLTMAGRNVIILSCSDLFILLPSVI